MKLQRRCGANAANRHLHYGGGVESGPLENQMSMKIVVHTATKSPDSGRSARLLDSMKRLKAVIVFNLPRSNVAIGPGLSALSV